MTRRQFGQRAARFGLAALAGSGLLAACGALDRSSSGPSIPRIGFLSPNSNKGTPRPGWVKQGLTDFGYVEGRAHLDWRFAEDDAGLRREADTLVASKVDVVIAGGHHATLAAIAATRSIPIVMAADGDPLGTGLITSLARPGGNVTGLSMLSVGLSRKRLEIFTQAFPSLTRVGVTFDPTADDKKHDYAETREGARILGVEIVPLEVTTAADMPAARAAVARARIDGVLTLWDGLVTEVAQLALDAGIPSICEGRGFPLMGGLMSFGPNTSTWYPRAAQYVDRILRGAKPADLPVEQPTEFELVINLKTAQTIGVTIPDDVIAQAGMLIR